MDIKGYLDGSTGLFLLDPNSCLHTLLCLDQPLPSGGRAIMKLSYLKSSFGRLMSCRLLHITYKGTTVFGETEIAAGGGRIGHIMVWVAKLIIFDKSRTDGKKHQLQVMHI